MNKKSIFAALGLMLITAQASHGAKTLSGKDQKSRFDIDSLERIAVKDINCEELVHLTKVKYLFVGGGQILAKNSGACFDVTSRNFDFFQSEGTFIRTKGGFCKVWGCTGIRDNGGRSGS